MKSTIRLARIIIIASALVRTSLSCSNIDFITFTDRQNG